MVQSVLSGKTQEMYMSVSVTVRKDCVKGCVKRIRIGAVTYLPPKVFFSDFAGEKDGLCAPWCKSEKVDNEYDELHQLILVKEFKDCLPDRVKVYFNEKMIR